MWQETQNIVDNMIREGVDEMCMRLGIVSKNWMCSTLITWFVIIVDLFPTSKGPLELGYIPVLVTILGCYCLVISNNSKKIENQLIEISSIPVPCG